MKQEHADLQTHSRRQSRERKEKQRYSDTEREIHTGTQGEEATEAEQWEMEQEKGGETDGSAEPGPDAVSWEEERSGDYDWETGEDVDRERGGEEEDLERERERARMEMERETELHREEGERDLEREEWERRRREEMERGRERGYDEETGQPYPPEYFYPNVNAQCFQNTLIIMTQFVFYSKVGDLNIQLHNAFNALYISCAIGTTR